ncbi:MAG: HigA family addiction module antitoxin [Gemmatimonadota bacterium]|nr:HigA family addiction module antitoxin [Gemmatimonadota bacterium]
MSVKNGMRPVHPGEILCEELETLGLSANELAEALDVPSDCISEVLSGQRDVTADIALRIAR